MSDDTGGRPPEPHAAFLVMALGRRIREATEKRLRARDLSMRHLAALGHLSRDPGCSYSELARRAGVTAQSMQATLVQLEKLQAVERRTPAGRGRRARLHVTVIGEELAAWGRSVLADLDDEFFGHVPEELRSTVTGVLLGVFAGGVDDRVPETG
ncbi:MULTISPECIES: MarR family winged helix-turn-helix transcriptional regulator [Pseudonocardia]|uniref:MarR family protein n=2 Tax=Pseudonocardia TaxID=1847 RepID=A0A1Y2MME1_PSEAH|nr:MULTISPECIES: MarR family winged helix-turn-helix transcriptional regulator [Pseudonocardia]OSY36251.1 MarR family protein [Pseudonocardia autotrophica]TDN73059.1 DNA-binding MarR family transcriptional regulator [Pseudonocardia autotrophica]BBG03777.1 hypothetical protein Pdca_49860 [Pseudonocardia autotrophica]GEC26615.1 hypothetical protein PSA01_36440 [Pseudonocardia saturnea]